MNINNNARENFSLLEKRKEYKIMEKTIYTLIKELNKVTTDYLKLEDSLVNASEFSSLSIDIEDIAIKLLLLNTDISENELLKFLDSGIKK